MRAEEAVTKTTASAVTKTTASAVTKTTANADAVTKTTANADAVTATTANVDAVAVTGHAGAPPPRAAGRQAVQFSVLCRTPEQVAAAVRVESLTEVAVDFLEVHGLQLAGGW